MCQPSTVGLGKKAGLSLSGIKTRAAKASLCLTWSVNWGLSPLGATVHAAAPWALGFAAVATGAALCMVLAAAVLWQRKVSVTHEINVLQ